MNTTKVTDKVERKKLKRAARKKAAPKDGSFAHLPVAAVLLKPFDPLRLASQVADALGWKTE